MPVTNVVWTGNAGDAAQRGVLPTHREHREDGQQVVVPRSPRRALPVQHDPTDEHERQQEPGLDAQHASRRRGPDRRRNASTNAMPPATPMVNTMIGTSRWAARLQSPSPTKTPSRTVFPLM